MFSFFKKKSVTTEPAALAPSSATAPPLAVQTEPRSWLNKLRGASGEPSPAPPVEPAPTVPTVEMLTDTVDEARRGWLDKLRGGLRKTGKIGRAHV